MEQEIITLITGANRGMGLELAKEIGKAGQHILVGTRNKTNGEQTVQMLREMGITADFVQLDLTDQASIKQAAATITERFGYLSSLINNAGATFDHHEVPSKLTTATMRKDFDLNFFGTIDVIQALLPLLKRSPKAKIITISSMMGSLWAATTPEAFTYRASAAGYQASKAALNMYSVKLAKELMDEGENITVNVIDPGLVATEFGGTAPEITAARGGKTVAEGIARTVELALDFEDLTTATFSNTDGIVPW